MERRSSVREQGTRPSPDEALVAPHEELRLQLLHRLHDHADDDEDARTAEPQRLHTGEVTDERRHDRDDAEEQRARDRDPRDDPAKELRGRTAGPDAWDETAVPLDVVGHVVR